MSDNEIEVTEVVVGDAPVGPGIPDGSVNTNPVTGEQETLVYEYDDGGNYIGWHKESVSNG